MSKQIAMMPLAACIAAALLSTHSVAEQLRRVQLLEEQVSVLEEQQAELNRISNVTVNGFFTLSGGMASNDAGYAGYDKTLDYEPETKVGLQASFEVTESTYLVTQLVARAEQHWSPEIEWAFLSHTFDNDLTLRAGRLRVPLYMYSDYLEVNFAQPWLRPPEEIYAVVPVSSYEGVDFVYTIPFDEAEWLFQAYTGVGSDPDSETGFGTDVKYDDVMGFSSSFTYNSFTVRASYVMTTLNSGQAFVPGSYNRMPLFNFDDSDSNFLGLGASYDDGDLLVVAEWTRSEADGSGLPTNLDPGTINYSGNWQDIDSAYISVAYRFGNITPYVTYAIMETSDDDERQATSDDGSTGVEELYNKANQIIFDGQRTTYSAGVRYDVNANMALKFDVTYSGDFDDAGGTGGLSGNISDKWSGQSTEEDTMVYTASLNMVF
jgi:opacity protein-like surface antigen